jgi:VWFA-related protein
MPLPRAARGIAVGAAVLVLLGPPARADDEPPKFEGGVDIVAVDASVVDGKGQPVRDLAPEEFLVKVDGRTRRVLSAEFVGLHVGASSGTAATGAPVEAGASAAPPTERREGRNFVLVVDRGQLSVGSIKSATQAASRLLDQLAPDDRVALFSLPSGPRVDFTSDRAALEKALARIGPAQDRWSGEFNISLAEAIAFMERRDRTRVTARECEKYLNTPRTSDEEACAQRVETEAQQQVDEQQTSVDDRLGALEALVQALGQVPGPKTLVLASGGFTAVTTGATPRVGQRLRRVATAAAAARVSLYSLYFPQRLESMAASLSKHQNTVDDNQQTRAQGLEMLTGMSGGAMFEVVAGANFAFERVASETSGHYLLGLEPAKRDRDGKPHDIEVKVSRKGVDVRARRQFVMAAASAPSRVRPAPLLPAAPPASPFRLATHVLRGNSAGQIKVVMATQVDGFSDARFDIQVLDPAGAVVGSLAEHERTAEGGPVRHDETILLPRGFYTLKAKAVDAGGRQALVERPLNAELSHGVGFDVSDLLILETVGEKMRLSASGSIGSDTMAVYLELYMHDELPTDRIGITVEVIGADGARRSVTSLPLRNDAAKGLLYAEGVVDLWTLPPGPYVARALVMFGTKTARTVERAFDFKGRGAVSPRSDR